MSTSAEVSADESTTTLPFAVIAVVPSRVTVAVDDAMPKPTTTRILVPPVLLVRSALMPMALNEASATAFAVTFTPPAAVMVESVAVTVAVASWIFT